MFGQLSRVIYPGGGGAPPLPCPIIYGGAIDEINTCTCVAVGTKFGPGDFTFTWNVYEPTLLTPDSLVISDPQTGNDIVIDQPVTSPLVVPIPYEFTRNSTGLYRFILTFQGACGPVSTTVDIEFCLPILHEGAMNPNLVGAELPVALNATMQHRYPGTFSERGAGYKYWAVPVGMMETDALATTRPNIVYDLARFGTDFVDPNQTMTDAGSGITFNPMYAMEDSYVTMVSWGGPTYAYNVFRSTYIMNGGLDIKVQDHL